MKLKTEAKTAVDLAVIATGMINADDEKASMQRAREDVRCIARLFELDAEQLWKDAFDVWYAIAREAYGEDNEN